MNKRLNAIFKGDKVIWMVFFFLCLVSVIEVFSASSSLTYKTGDYLGPTAKHIGILCLGILLMLVTLNIKCRYFKLATPILLGLSVFTLLLVLVAGHAVNGAGRWLSIFGMQFQPSEIAKGTMVLSTAQILSAMQTDHGADRHAFQYIFIVWLCIVPMIMFENLSTAALLSVVIFMMMIIGRVPTRQLLRVVAAVAIIVVMALSSVLALGDEKEADDNPQSMTEMVAKNGKTIQTKKHHGLLHRMGTWKARIYNFMDNKYVPPEKVDLDKDAQTAYANIAIASSNIIGKGPGNSEERDFLPQAFSDYIYAIIIEETGLLGAFLVAMLYIILLFRTGRIANRCENNFPAFLAMGLALMLVVQALFNMCVAVGIVPVTGQPLPLISKGGTSSIINCIYIGAILSVSRTAKKNGDDTAKGQQAVTAKATTSADNTEKND
ncbi:rod shape-determining protein RodA [Hallella multisaccharivorax DSM 17128]|uniref:Probable peptidoglycan glycosyltransferase FtsW n=1 Tax=Hallella multisaccharivorax DSM 17128 TaxID=688246 RepID=F8NB82_9BACT|nr:FtsW/RodA/SpoVE family cell cycle protein [Hallella multisaccharivorax]EGN55900.1 cell cycle protein [Hallella multisaccharivorax DSM 17128]GJG29395.1 rod shape-determining protein RodA [Hallella multisaccharivorax DSM 17128]